jgi:hypothetical protein
MFLTEMDRKFRANRGNSFPFGTGGVEGIKFAAAGGTPQ